MEWIRWGWSGVSKMYTLAYNGIQLGGAGSLIPIGTSFVNISIINILRLIVFGHWRLAGYLLDTVIYVHRGYDMCQQIKGYIKKE